MLLRDRKVVQKIIGQLGIRVKVKVMNIVLAFVPRYKVQNLEQGLEFSCIIRSGLGGPMR